MKKDELKRLILNLLDSKKFEILYEEVNLNGGPEGVMDLVDEIAELYSDKEVEEQFTTPHYTPPTFPVNRVISEDHNEVVRNGQSITTEDNNITDPYTKEEMRDLFLQNCHTMATYWAYQGCSVKDKCEGLVFSILNIIDGLAGGFPSSIDLVLSQHPENKEYFISQGEKWIQHGQVINDDCMLHEIYAMTIRK